MKPFYVVTKIIRSPGKMKAYFFIQNCFKCDYYHYKVLSVIMTITVQGTVAFGNARITL